MSKFFEDLDSYGMLFTSNIDLIVVCEENNKKTLRSEVLYRVANTTGWPINTLEANELTRETELVEEFEAEFGLLKVPCLLVYAPKVGIECVMDYEQAVNWLLGCSHDHMILNGVDLAQVYRESALDNELEELYFQYRFGDYDDTYYDYDDDDYGDEDQQALMALIDDYIEDDPQIPETFETWRNLKVDIQNVCKSHMLERVGLRLSENTAMFDGLFSNFIYSFSKGTSIAERKRVAKEKEMKWIKAKIELLTGKKIDDTTETAFTVEQRVEDLTEDDFPDELPF